MGKLNKKLPLKFNLKIGKQPDPKSDPGPFPIYRTKPVQLNGPEPKNFKIPPNKTKVPAKVTPAELDSSQANADTVEEIPVKSKKLRKLAISRLNKKDKKRFRKEEVLKKIELTQTAFKENKEKKKREKTVVTGDMRPLLDALPSLDSLFKLKAANSIKTGVPKYDKNMVPKTKRQLKAAQLKKNRIDFLNRCKKMNQVLKSKKFKRNPKKMIADHIRNVRKEQLQLLLESS
ncbi:ribosome biogenesis protein SLX9 homolog [Topomyia yanbarensis]|uniref:ribosome biogenesis protein SLX9 homolog n=1 Tax=Topomyia yanbarensis TaxID=2498891 RepID=UPI00273AECCB|nr:ribosome biogenesis protein SLX9 homolog [Topomyia yanbarensis]